MKVFISTGAFRTKKLEDILRMSGEMGIKNIEISPGLDHCDNIYDILLDDRDKFNFLIHNYFPTPKEPFALNLASSNDEIISKSMQMCYNAIDFISEMGIGHYSVHCGYCFDTSGRELGSSTQLRLPRIAYERAKENFAENMRKICGYASSKKVKVAIENNVLANFAGNDRELCLGVTHEDMLELSELIGHQNLYFLLDLAHAKVSSKTLGFKLEDMVRDLSHKVIEYHISENDGLSDQNRYVDGDSTLLELINLHSNIPMTIEVYDLSKEEILSQIGLFGDLEER